MVHRGNKPRVITGDSAGEFEVRIPLDDKPHGIHLLIYVDQDNKDHVHVFLHGAQARQLAVLPLAANHFIIREVETP